MSSSAMKAALLELAPGFERATGHKVVASWIPGVDLMRRVKDGETGDLVIMQASAIDELIKLGRIAPGSRVDLAKSGVGVAVRAGAAKPDISSAAALKRALMAAKLIAYSTGPSGVYLAGLFQRLGIADELKARLRQVKGEPVGAVVARGEAEIGFQQVSELLPVPGIDFLGPLPADIQQVTVFSSGLQVGTQAPAAAKALVEFITAPAAAPVIRKKGLEPA
jgi:molybdate transport system substrate-binding protein